MNINNKVPIIVGWNRLSSFRSSKSSGCSAAIENWKKQNKVIFKNKPHSTVTVGKKNLNIQASKKPKFLKKNYRNCEHYFQLCRYILLILQNRNLLTWSAPTLTMTSMDLIFTFKKININLLDLVFLTSFSKILWPLFKGHLGVFYSIIFWKTKYFD